MTYEIKAAHKSFYIEYFIGEKYKYPEGDEFILKNVNGFCFVFDKNHWCADLVFMDLIRVKTNQRVCDFSQQLEISL